MLPTKRNQSIDLPRKSIDWLIYVESLVVKVLNMPEEELNVLKSFDLFYRRPSSN